MAEIKSEPVADFIPESVADFTRNTQVSPQLIPGRMRMAARRVP